MSVDERQSGTPRDFMHGEAAAEQHGAAAADRALAGAQQGHERVAQAQADGGHLGHRSYETELSKYVEQLPQGIASVPQRCLDFHKLPHKRPGMNAAIPEERRLVIMERVRSRSLVKPAELADELGVSTETIRRDLVALEEDGLVRRVYGGATGTTARAFEPAFEKRLTRHRDRKKAIGRMAASLIGPDDTVIFDIGTTVAELTGGLPVTYRGIVLTNSLLVANVLAGRDNIEVITSGGRVRSGDLACFGPVSEAFFRDYYADKAFMGAGGVDPIMGLTDYYPDEIASRRVILEHAAERYVLADSSKLGLVAFGKVCDLSALSAVITDDHADEREIARLEEAGLTVTIATVEGGGTATDTAKGGRRTEV